MKRFRKLATGILAVAMLVTAIPLSVSGAEINKAPTGSGWEYNDKTVTDANGCTAKIVGSSGYTASQKYDDISDAKTFERLVKGTSGKRVRLLNNIKLGAKEYVVRSNTLLQLNGKTLTIPRGGKLTISGTNIEIKGNNKGCSMGAIVGENKSSAKSETNLIDIANNSSEIRFYNAKISSSKYFNDTIRIGAGCNKISVLNSIIRQYGDGVALKACGTKDKVTKNVVTTNLNLASNGIGVYTTHVSGLGIGGNTDCSIASTFSGKKCSFNVNNSRNIYLGLGNKKTDIDSNNGIGVRLDNSRNVTFGKMTVESNEDSRYAVSLTNNTSNVVFNSVMSFAGKAPYLYAEDSDIIKITAPDLKSKKTLSKAKFNACSNVSILKCICTNLNISNSYKFGIGGCNIKGTTNISNSNQFYLNYESNLYGRLNINNSNRFKLCNTTAYNIIDIFKSSTFTMNSTLTKGKTTNDVYIILDNCSGSNSVTTKIPIK